MLCWVRITEKLESIYSDSKFTDIVTPGFTLVY